MRPGGAQPRSGMEAAGGRKLCRAEEAAEGRNWAVEDGEKVVMRQVFGQIISVWQAPIWPRARGVGVGWGGTSLWGHCLQIHRLPGT